MHSDSIRQTGEQITLNRLIPLAAFVPGRYMLQVNIQDRVSGQALSREAEFQIVPESSPDARVGKHGAPVLTFFLHEKAHWRALEWPRLQL
jgi:hypothetical protein